MSLVSFATRLIICRCIKGKTFAGDNVLNAPVEPLDHVLAVESAPTVPTIAVFSGQAKAKAAGRDMTGGQRELGISIQIFCPTQAVVTVNDVPLAFEARGPGAAALLDFTWRQVAAALVLENGVWPKLFADFVAGIDDIVATPVLYEIAKTDKGPRVPAMEYDIGCRVMNEPKFGVPLANHWLRLDQAMRAEPELIPMANLIKDLIEKPNGMPGWRVTQAALGLSDDAIRASGLAPEDPTEPEEAAELSETDGDVTIEPADLTQTVPNVGGS